MLDYRMTTFLTLCEIMNYRLTAQKLNITQPAVTQHIKFLEAQYCAKLFEYSARKLSKTKACLSLEQYTRTAMSLNNTLCKTISSTSTKSIRLGATKTIGEYVIPHRITELVKKEDVRLSLTIGNTQMLLGMLNHFEIDCAIIEGFFDKNSFDYALYKSERFVGICGKQHHFCGKSISFENILSENLILREAGSGTRAIFEQVLHENNLSLNSFERSTTISSFNTIRHLIKENCGISFVYESIPNSDPSLGVFELSGNDILREFNFVFLKNTLNKELIELFL